MFATRRTISKRISFEGIGLHSGERCVVTLSPGEDGVVFRFGGESRERFPVESARVVRTARRTALAFPGGLELQTTEHLLAAIAGLEIDDAEISVEGGEVPVLDGSALPFARGILDAGIDERAAPRRVVGLNVPVCAGEGPRVAIAIPSRETRITYTIEYGGAVGTQCVSVALTPESFVERVAGARTFGLASEVDALRAAGLIKGGSLDNALIFDEGGPINEGGYRFPGECAAHKALDLLGDLALVGQRVTAHYVCFGAGHEIHAALVARVKRALAI